MEFKKEKDLLPENIVLSQRGCDEDILPFYKRVPSVELIRECSEAELSHSEKGRVEEHISNIASLVSQEAANTFDINDPNLPMTETYAKGFSRNNPELIDRARISRNIFICNDKDSTRGLIHGDGPSHFYWGVDCQSGELGFMTASPKYTGVNEREEFDEIIISTNRNGDAILAGLDKLPGKFVPDSIFRMPRSRCPMDYFSPEGKESFFSLLGDLDPEEVNLTHIKKFVIHNNQRELVYIYNKESEATRAVLAVPIPLMVDGVSSPGSFTPTHRFIAQTQYQSDFVEDELGIGVEDYFEGRSDENLNIMGALIGCHNHTNSPYMSPSDVRGLLNTLPRHQGKTGVIGGEVGHVIVLLDPTKGCPEAMIQSVKSISRSDLVDDDDVNDLVWEAVEEATKKDGDTDDDLIQKLLNWQNFIKDFHYEGLAGIEDYIEVT